MSHAPVPSFMDAFAAARPVYEQAAKQLTPAEAVRTVEYVLTWRWLIENDGHEPTAERHAEALDVSRATYYRRREAFRRAFPEAATPSEVKQAPGLAIPTLRAVLAVG